jgi:hypothetical protein
LSTLRGIVVRLHTGTDKSAGTHDPIYVGVSGTAGGREFPLDVAGFDDFERRSRVKYGLGQVWEEDALVGALEPRGSKDDWNDPALSHLGFSEIDRVYLRKHCGRRRLDDDAWQLDEVDVSLYGDEGEKRHFRCSTGLWLGIGYGAQVWLPEVDPSNLSVSLRA